MKIEIVLDLFLWMFVLTENKICKVMSAIRNFTRIDSLIDLIFYHRQIPVELHEAFQALERRITLKNLKFLIIWVNFETFELWQNFLQLFFNRQLCKNSVAFFIFPFRFLLWFFTQFIGDEA